MNRIEKKILPKYFELVKSGKKTFEVRLGDFEGKEGDILILKEWDGKKYTGRELERIITYTTNTLTIKFWPEEDIKKYGYTIIALGNPEYKVRAKRSIKALSEKLEVLKDESKRFEEMYNRAVQYYEDAKHYFEKGDYFTSFGASDYAYGILDMIEYIINNTGNDI